MNITSCWSSEAFLAQVGNLLAAPAARAGGLIAGWLLAKGVRFAV